MEDNLHLKGEFTKPECDRFRELCNFTEDQRNIMVGLQNDEIIYVPLSKAIKQKKDINADKWAAMQILSI